MSSSNVMSLHQADKVGRQGVYCEIDGLEVDMDAHTLNTAGMFVRTTTDAAIDESLEIFLRSKAGESVQVTGLVVQVVSCEEAAANGKAPGFGVLFTNLNDGQRAFLRRLAALYAPPAPDTSTTAAAPPKRQPTTKRITTHGLQPPTKVRIDRLSTSKMSERPCTPVKQLLGELHRELERLDSHTPWRILGIARDAEAKDARSAYHAKIKRYHPHRFARYRDEKISELVTQVFIGYKHAYLAFKKDLVDARRARGKTRKL